MKWLDTLIDGDWDKDTEKNKAEAKKLLLALEADAKKYAEFEARRKATDAVKKGPIQSLMSSLRLTNLWSLRSAMVLGVVLLSVAAMNLSQSTQGTRTEKAFATDKQAEDDFHEDREPTHVR